MKRLASFAAIAICLSFAFVPVEAQLFNFSSRDSVYSFLDSKSAGGLPTDLFISEYIEGTSNNQAIEIYNGTGAPISLGGGFYSLEIYFNGSTTPATTLNLNGTIASGDVYVIASSSASGTILAQADRTSALPFYDGDDAIVLRKADLVVDVIGQVGFDPGIEWGTGDQSTADNTLTRKGTVCAGDTNTSDAFVPSTEWDGFPVDTFTSLGSHTAMCGQPPPTVTTSAATNVTSSGGTLNGLANPNGFGTTGWFRASATNPGVCDDSFGLRIPFSGGINLGSGTSSLPYSRAMSGLLPGTTIYYCAIAQNAGGTSFGSVMSFTTTATLPTVQFGSATFTDDESQTMQVRLTRTGDTTGGSTVQYATSNGTAATGVCGSGGDYVAASGAVEFNAGVTEQFVSVPLCSDTSAEAAENFSITLSNPTGATLGSQSTATGNINDTAGQFRDASPVQLFGPAAVPYPAQITVAGGPAAIGRIRVTLYDLVYANPDDIDVLLVGPGGQQILLIADAGGSNAISSPATLTFTDTAGQVLPGASLIGTGLYEPTSWGAGVETNFPSPAPGGPYNEPGSAIGGTPSLSSIFGGLSPNGTWSLYIRSDDGGDFAELGASSGFLGGWGLELIAPTAANVSLSGRINDADGRGLSNVVVTIGDGGLSSPTSTRSNSFGNYSFEGLPAGHVYIVSVSSRRYAFNNPTQAVSVMDNVTGVDFTTFGMR